ncbi:hypothetical protein EYF80_028015 [Liparis tanakae]|uniref:Uncharacterized protein n=1 Tax=Liparis tanakae TaxID=230148 RepID=A0A4Z2H9T4_9TELE|nr:hypothetical protein EYF80_028015 [Liparis tanakae]
MLKVYPKLFLMEWNVEKDPPTVGLLFLRLSHLDFPRLRVNKMIRIGALILLTWPPCEPVCYNPLQLVSCGDQPAIDPQPISGSNKKEVNSQ